MSDYIKGTNFAAKDSLPTGDPGKIVRGTEIDDEFNAIAGAVSSKRDSTSTVPIANGGTGQTTANAAINALLPSQTGNSGRYLTTNGTNTSWGTVVGGVTSVTASTPLASSGGTTPNISITGQVAIGNGGTGASTSTGARANLGLGTLATLNSVNLATNVTGTLLATNGGTNLSTYAVGDILYCSATNVLNKRSIGSTGQVLTVSGGVPTWQNPTGGGDVTGPASATNEYVALFDGTTGKLIKNSINTDGRISGVRVGRGAGGVSSNTVVGNGNVGRVMTTAASSTLIGTDVGYSLTSGDNNTYVGTYSGYYTTTGFNNTAVGRGAGEGITTGSNNLCLGLQAGTGTSPFSVTTSSNRIVLGDSSITNAYIQVAWTVVSDVRDKEDITDAPYGLDFVSRLRPVQYKWDRRSDYYTREADGTIVKNPKTGIHKKDKIEVGFIAQEVIALEKEFGAVKPIIGDDEQEDMLKVTETKFIPVLVKAIQELKAELDAVKAELATLKAN